MKMEQSSLSKTKSQQLFQDSVHLLKRLITFPSFSGSEEKAAAVLADFFQKKRISFYQKRNNILVRNYYFDPAKPSILLNSHTDTVRPTSSYTRDPFSPEITDGKLYGLGSNDAGGCLVSLAAVFLYFYNEKELPCNLIFVASAEEEISGTDGIELILPELNNAIFAIVGEPTQMEMALAERGLLVLDCTSYGVAGHAAREEGINAVYKAIKDISWLKEFSFPLVSPVLGPVKISVTSISSVNEHNITPSECKFTVDIRVNELYRNEEILSVIRKNISSDVKPRSLRLQSSSISIDHPFVIAGKKLGMKTYGSPTSSDMALIPYPSVKLGPGDSARSHTADEFIFLEEISSGIELYIKYLESIFLTINFNNFYDGKKALAKETQP